LTWFSDAALTTTISNTVSPTTTKTYYAACVNGICTSPSANVTVNVTTMPSAPTALTASPSAICSGESSTLAGNCSLGPLTWFSDAALTTTISNTVSPTSTTTYYAACVNGICTSVKDSVKVNVTTMPSAPTALTASPSAICSGESSTLTGNCSLGTLTWFSDAALTTTISNTVSPTSTTTYYAACVNGICTSVKDSVKVSNCIKANSDEVRSLGGKVNINVLESDTFNGNKPSLNDVSLPTISTPSSNGVVTVNQDGTIDYQPNPGFSGTDTFYYTICDSKQPTNCSTTKVTITVNPPSCNPEGVKLEIKWHRNP